MPIDPYRLPTSVRPTAYHITIEPDLDAETFTGQVTIDAVVEEPVEEVVLNSDSLTITAATIAIAGASDGQTEACKHAVDTELERLTLTPPEVLDPGEITIELAFSGAFNPRLVGLYASRFTDDDGEEHKLASTQFEATHARWCFPCWDEPEFKATFALSLVVADGHQAVANGPETGRQTLEDGRTRIDFAPTMVMSTYLVAFVVGPLEMTEPVDVDGVPLRVVHVPGKGHLTDFALEAGAFALRYFTDYFGLPYPDQKLDMIAIPDFAFGAMENLGCVTFREVILLIDPERATQPELQRTADVVNHELAHMWFGDLVTMKWWNGLWLNEAFATFMEMRCTDAFRPEWDRWTDFGLSRTEAFATDTLATTRPIEYEVVSPADADGMFDILTYEKGAAVVRMLEQYLGEEPFRAGIRHYMQTHQYGNAETTDLWDALEETTGEPVRRIMDTWIFQGGFPLISVGSDDGGFTLTQERMQNQGGGEAPDTDWIVPIRYRWQPTDADAEPRSSRLLLEPDGPATISTDQPSAWLVANDRGSGFYRTTYPAELAETLADLPPEVLNPVERYGLVDDGWAAVLAGRSSTLSFLNLLEAMTAETNRSVWVRIIAGFGQLKRLVDGEAKERLEEIIHDALAPALANLGLAPEDDDTESMRQLRGDLVRGLGISANDPEIQEEAKRAVATGRRDPQLVDAPLLAASVEVVASSGDEADFDDFVTAWRAADTPQEELRYLGALMDFPDADLVARTHPLILDGSIRSQNAPLLLRRALGNRECGRATWAFIAEHWDTLTEMFAAGLMVRMVEGVASLDTEEDVAAVATFFQTNTVPTGTKTLQQILEKQRVRAALRNREAENLTRFLTA
ncbi:MAG: M1 family aminopeptidase [Actinomycetota bacterium]